MALRRVPVHSLRAADDAVVIGGGGAIRIHRTFAVPAERTRNLSAGRYRCHAVYGGWTSSSIALARLALGPALGLAFALALGGDGHISRGQRRLRYCRSGVDPNRPGDFLVDVIKLLWDPMVCVDHRHSSHRHSCALRSRGPITGPTSDSGNLERACVPRLRRCLKPRRLGGDPKSVSAIGDPRGPVNTNLIVRCDRALHGPAIMSSGTANQFAQRLAVADNYRARDSHNDPSRAHIASCVVVVSRLTPTMLPRSC
jgi:hypothetical protein